MTSALHRLAVVAALLALFVIILGSWVRLSHAGLGCPDWPGCYGQLTWPDAASEIHTATQAFPERPVESDKAWREMIHRYLAGILVLLVLAINILAWKRSSRLTRAGHRVIAGFLLALILFQAVLGMWTVTLKLLPIVVMGHLLGGFATFALLAWLAFRSRLKGSYAPPRSLRQFKPLLATGLLILILQVSLGGWTSANYSALVCADFPGCQGQLWPETNFVEGFVLWREVGVDYEGGVLDLPARSAIHMAHRIGALITFAMLMFVSIRLFRVTVTQRAAIWLGFLTLTQVALGIMNVVLHLPLANAVAHNGLAAVLMAMLVWLLHRASPSRAW